MKERISVVVRSKNEEHTIRKTLRMIVSQTVKPDEIILVDNASRDCTKQIAAQFGCQIVNISDREFNHAVSCNMGAEACSGDLIVFTNAHAFPRSSTWLESGVQHFAFPSVAGVYGLPAPDARASVWERLTNTSRSSVFGESQVRRIHKFSIRTGLGLMSTTSAVVRRNLWQEHPFRADVSAFGGGEDSEWGFYHLKQGYCIVEDPDFAVYHCHGDGLVRYITRCFFYYLTYLVAYGTNRL